MPAWAGRVVMCCAAGGAAQLPSCGPRGAQTDFTITRRTRAPAHAPPPTLLPHLSVSLAAVPHTPSPTRHGHRYNPTRECKTRLALGSYSLSTLPAPAFYGRVRKLTGPYSLTAPRPPRSCLRTATLSHSRPVASPQPHCSGPVGIPRHPSGAHTRTRRRRKRGPPAGQATGAESDAHPAGT